MRIDSELVGGPRDGQPLRIEVNGGIPYEIFVPCNGPKDRFMPILQLPDNPAFKVHVYRRIRDSYRYVGIG